ncbi:MAG: nuclear transport factor 2 family protein [Arenimonas sp.]
MRKHLAQVLTLCVAVAGCPTAYAARSHASPSDTAAIKLVVESFRKSLIDKDKPTYMSLFFSDKPEDIGWQFVSEDTRLEHIRQSKPDAIKARQIPGNNFVSLIDGAVATREPREETFSNVSIDTDGEIASVAFDYSFLANGQKTNWGREMWQLVRTEQGWKIFSVVYTIRDQWSAGGG